MSKSPSWIVLKATLSEKLDWKRELAAAKVLKDEGKKIFWELDLGLASPFYPLEDEFSFQGLSLALSHFAKEVYPRFEKETEGVVIYRGDLDLKAHFVWSERQKENFSSWIVEHGGEPLFKEQFCLDSYAAYFQLLAHKLPDDLPVFLLFDASMVSRSEALYLLTKERFAHFELAAKGIACSSWCFDWQGDLIEKKREPRIGVSLPQECTNETLVEIEHLLSKLDAAQLDYRVFNEAYLTEEWDGLDWIVLLSASPRGKRNLMGFIAAGGAIVYAKEPIGIVDEISWEEFRGRGIRTPDLLVPNQPR